MLLTDADLGTPTGRDRALDELVPVLNAMPDSITREELEREVASKLEADPGLVRRRVAGHRAAREPQRAPPPAAADPGPEDGGAPVATQPARPLSARERRERSLLEMAIALPSDGFDFVRAADARAPQLAAGWAGLASGSSTTSTRPLEGLPADDDELVAVVTQLVMGSEREPASRDAMELNFLSLERAMVDGEIDRAAAGGGDPPVELQRRRAELSERIANFESGR